MQPPQPPCFHSAPQSATTSHPLLSNARAASSPPSAQIGGGKIDGGIGGGKIDGGVYDPDWGKRRSLM
ncbi:hypothetical protein PVAP13_2NG260300 [Panicum virgatum]|uniref:Uncharacterized protein n=1 Tax=Panicum virgatum TaxID=38727 RepID=A0A8T0V952_PANVG|nr:hypothetical protein PVAP13_2NG260300 [Panicum virgatum]